MSKMNRCSVLIVLAALTLGICCAPTAAEAEEIALVSVTGKNVSIRSAPGATGKVLEQASPPDLFLVDAAPVSDENGKPAWYRILFTVSMMDDDIYQAHKLPAYGFSYPYISAKFVKKESLTEYEGIQREIEYWKKGRPARVKVGDDVSADFKYYAAIFKLKAEAALLLEPRSGAGRVLLPAGTLMVFNDQTDGGVYFDMDETAWFHMAGENNKVLGWIKKQDWDSLSLERVAEIVGGIRGIPR